MKLRKKIFVFGGSLLIIIILAIRFDVISFLKKRVVDKEMKLENVEKSSPIKAREELKQREEENKDISDIDNKIVEAKVESQKVNQTVTPKVEPEKDFENAKLGIGDPFSYSTSSGGDYSPLTNSNKVGLITIRGIIAIKGQAAKAILHLNDTGVSYYVSKGDVIRINTKSKNSSLVTEAYISVKDIRNDEVELVQQERPDQVIIIR